DKGASVYGKPVASMPRKRNKNGVYLTEIGTDTQSAMDFILGANSQEQRERLTGWIGEIAAYYAAAPVRLGGAKVPHLMPGDSLNLQ
ncbi:hypothetical protein R8A67_23000, partial [Escherichia coli]|nr:hypothetical protein [Escherichia coli]